MLTIFHFIFYYDQKMLKVNYVKLNNIMKRLKLNIIFG